MSFHSALKKKKMCVAIITGITQMNHDELQHVFNFLYSGLKKEETQSCCR